MLILPVHTRKGGEGKTTCATNLAAAFARAGQLGLATRNLNTVVIDVDSQGNASDVLSCYPAPKDPTIAEVLAGQVPIDAAIRPTYLETLHVLPADDRLARAEAVLHPFEHAPRMLQMALDGRDEYDVAVLDCPPTIGLPFVWAMTAANAFVVPTSLDHLGIEGLRKLIEGLAAQHKHYGFQARCLGIALSKVDYRLERHKAQEMRAREAYRSAIFDSVIRVNTHVAEAQEQGVSVLDYAPSSRGAEGFRGLAGEVLRRAIRHRLLPADLFLPEKTAEAA